MHAGARFNGHIVTFIIEEGEPQHRFVVGGRGVRWLYSIARVLCSLNDDDDCGGLLNALFSLMLCGMVHPIHAAWQRHD